MSVRNVQGLNTTQRYLRKGFEDEIVSPSPINPWVRNKAWPTLLQPSSSSEQVIGLYAVWPDGGNFFAVNFSGNYSVDQGDGTTANVSAGVQRDYEYSFSSPSLYDPTVTFNSSGNLVQRVAHGYTNGDIVRFYRTVTATYLTENQVYYVINSTSDSFQVSTQSNGSAVVFTTNGSGSLTPYKIATVSVTPQAGQNLTTVDLFVKHSQTGLVDNYGTGWLDLAISGPNITTLKISQNATAVRHVILERANIISLGQVTTFNGLFNACSALKSVSIAANTQFVTQTGVMFFNCSSLTHAPMFDTSAVTSFTAMFQGCTSLSYVPLYNTANGTSFASMFQGCPVLVTVPFFDTGNSTSFVNMFASTAALTSALAYVPQFKTNKATAMNGMFQSCSSLTVCPFFETSLVTNMSNMFLGCTSLRSVPFFDTALVTNMSSMFQGCRSLSKVPCFSTGSVTNMSAMFQSCSSLLEIPELITSSVTNMANMFDGCSSIRTIPPLNTAAVNTMASMFIGCSKLKTIPPLNTAAVTTMASMFQDCISLESIPSLNTAAVTTMASMFGGCRKLKAVPELSTALVNTMASMFASCASLDFVPLLNTALVTTMASMFSGCSSLKTIPAFNTPALITATSMFQGCTSLERIPVFNTASVTAASSMFNACSSLSAIPALTVTGVSSSANFSNFAANCNSLIRVEAKNFRFTFSLANGKLSKTSLEEVFSNLPTVATSQTITITSNYGIGTLTTKTASTTLRSTTINMADTSGLSTGMIIHSGTGTGITTGISATTDIAADTFTYTSHGLSNGTVVSFSAIGTTTGISTWTTYFVVNSTTNTFQVSLTLGGAAIDLTGSNSTVTARYANYIVSINPNVSITLSTPCASTATNSSLAFRTLNTANALLRNWAITF